MASQQNRALQQKLPKLKKQRNETKTFVSSQFAIYEASQHKFAHDFWRKQKQRQRLAQHF